MHGITIISAWLIVRNARGWKQNKIKTCNEAVAK